MSTESLDLTGPVCRACLQLGAKKQIFSIHKPTSMQYAYLLSSCASIQVEPEDEFPKYICKKCMNKLVNFYNFKNTVIENDIKLRKVLKKQVVPAEINSRECPDYVRVINELENGKVALNNNESTEQIKVTEDREYRILKTESIFSAEDVKFSSIKLESKEGCEIDDVQSGFDDSSVEECDTKRNVKSNKLANSKIKNTKIHQCDICGQTFRRKSSLSEHIRKHTGERPHACDICEKKFSRAEHLVIHKRIHTGERPHQCTICSKKFIDFAAIKVHLRTHSGERPYMCSVCGKSFSQPSSLVCHKRIHSGETPFVCKVCGKGFSRNGNLNTHMRYHNNERPYSCTMCGKKFVTNAHLKVHIKQHNGEKSHKCIVCGKAFVRSEHLKGHLVIHTGEKPYACKLCPKKYTQSGDLNRHIKKTHKGVS